MTPAPTAFISHAADDAATAAELCRHLESRGIRCWIAPRDVTPGREYAAEILSGIESCDAFVLLLSGHSNESLFVHREVERATSKGKAIFPVRIENVLPDRELELFISSAHWIDAWEPPQSNHWERLKQAIRGVRPTATPAGFRRHAPPAGANRASNLRFAAAVGIVVVAILAGSWIMRGERAPDATLPPATPARVAPAPPHETVPATSVRPASEPPPARTADDADAIGPCPQNLVINPDLPMPFSCRCSAEATREGTVWGTDLYTTDSSLCRAARHAGAVSTDGGAITVERFAGQDLYIGTARNSVTTNDYGTYSDSLHFAGTPQPPVPGPCPQSLVVNLELPTPFSCTCSAQDARDGAVWGTDTYTADSDLCRAAVHAGTIPPRGGTLTVEFAAGQPLYVGTRRNGVASHDYGAYSSSIRFR